MPLEAPVIRATLFSSLTLLSSDPLEVALAFPIRHGRVESILFCLKEMRVVRHDLFPKCPLCKVACRETLDSLS